MRFFLYNEWLYKHAGRRTTADMTLHLIMYLAVYGTAGRVDMGWKLVYTYV